MSRVQIPSGPLTTFIIFYSVKRLMAKGISKLQLGVILIIVIAVILTTAFLISRPKLTPPSVLEPISALQTACRSSCEQIGIAEIILTAQRFKDSMYCTRKFVTDVNADNQIDPETETNLTCYSPEIGVPCTANGFSQPVGATGACTT